MASSLISQLTTSLMSATHLGLPGKRASDERPSGAEPGFDGEGSEPSSNGPIGNSAAVAQATTGRKGQSDEAPTKALVTAQSGNAADDTQGDVASDMSRAEATDDTARGRTSAPSPDTGSTQSQDGFAKEDGAAIDMMDGAEIADGAGTSVSAGLRMDTGSDHSDGYTAVGTLSGTATPGARIHFTIDGAQIDAMVTADANGNWVFRPEGLSDGRHAVTVSVTDGNGNIAASSDVEFTLDTSAPDVTQSLSDDTGLSASDGYTSDGTLSGRADPNATVHFKVDGTAIDQTATADSNGNWTFKPQGLSDGKHVVQAYQIDAAGNGTLVSYSFTLDTIAPDVDVALSNDTGSSQTDRYTSDASVSGTAAPNAVLTVAIDGIELADEIVADSNGHWSFTPKDLSDGIHKLAVSETDRAGNVGTGTIYYTLDTTAPDLEASLFDDTGSSNSDNVTNSSTLTGSAEPNSEVTLTIDGKPVEQTLRTDAAGTWIYDPSGLADGTHTVTVSQTDAAGNIGQTDYSFTLDTTAPNVSAGLSSDTGVSQDDQITSDGALSGTAEAGSTLKLFVDGTQVAAPIALDANGDWRYTPTSLDEGRHEVRVEATDKAGNVGRSAFGFMLDTTAPTIDFPTTGGKIDDGEQTVSGTAEAGANVSILSDQTVLATVVAGPDGRWSADIVLAKGEQSIHATATDTAGNTASSQTVDYLVYSKVFDNPEGGDWNTDGNWKSGERPVSGDYVHIGDPVDVTISSWDDWYRGIQRLDTVENSSLTVTDTGMQITGASDIEGTLATHSAFLVVNGDIKVGTLEIDKSASKGVGGRVGGTGDVLVTSALTWNQGIMDGTGKTIVGADATATFGNGYQFLAREFEIQGKGSLENAGLNLDFYNGEDGNLYHGQLSIGAGGSLSMDDGSTIGVSNSSTERSLMSNEGTFTKTGAGTSNITEIDVKNVGDFIVEEGALDISGVSLDNSGTMTVKGTVSGSLSTSIRNSGTIALDGGWVDTNLDTNSGTVSLSSGSELDLNGDTHNSGSIIVGDESGVFALGQLIGGGTIDMQGKGGFVELTGASDNTMKFGNASEARVKIDDSDTFGGKIEGFGLNSSLELADIISDSMRMSFFQGEDGSVLRVSDGQDTANLHLSGTTKFTDFKVSGSEGGGTLLAHA